MGLAAWRLMASPDEIREYLFGHPGVPGYPPIYFTFNQHPKKLRIVDMTPEEVQFLLAEFNQSWLLINAIDERRGKFLQSITTVVIAAIGAVGFLITTEKGILPLNRTIEVIALIVATIVACLSVLFMLLAERDANIRCRKKANLIRHCFLANSSSPAVQDYLLNYKHLGILVPGDSQEPKGVGRTLPAVLCVLAVQLLGLIFALFYVLARHNGFYAG